MTALDIAHTRWFDRPVFVGFIELPEGSGEIRALTAFNGTLIAVTDTGAFYLNEGRFEPITVTN